jgi:hypothetical protein
MSRGERAEEVCRPEGELVHKPGHLLERGALLLVEARLPVGHALHLVPGGQEPGHALLPLQGSDACL